jgi:hypothetical protein
MNPDSDSQLCSALEDVQQLHVGQTATDEVLSRALDDYGDRNAGQRVRDQSDVVQPSSPIGK